MIDIDFGDVLDYLASDPNTRAILLYIEAVTQARKFMSAARAAARVKPVIAIKAGRHEAAAGAGLRIPARWLALMLFMVPRFAAQASFDC